MTAKRIFVTIEFDYVPGVFDYPKNAPLPRIGETLIYDNGRVNNTGKCYEIRHIISGKVADIKIKVARAE